MSTYPPLPLSGAAGPSVRFTRTRRQDASVVLGVVGGAAVGAGVSACSSGGSGAALGQALLLLTVVAAVMAGGLLLLRPCLELTPVALHIRSMGWVELDWSQVSSVDVVRVRGGGRCLAFRTVDGQVHRSAVPADGWLQRDPDFDDKAEYVHRWWRDHRGW